MKRALFVLVISFTISTTLLAFQNHNAESADSKNYFALGCIREYPSSYALATPLATPPPSWDWRDVNGTNYMTPVKDQGACGSCTAFAAVGAFEAVIKIKQGVTTDLSEAHLFFCSGGDCDFGWYISNTLDYLRDYGTPDENCFPYGDAYNGNDLPCSNTCEEWQQRAWKIDEWGWVASYNIKNALITYGPLVAGMDVYEDFYDYWSNPDDWPNQVYYHRNGTKLGGHAVVIVGYDDAGQYWICKNSWGSSGGINGYFKIRYGEAGIESSVAYLSYTPSSGNIPPTADFSWQPSMPTTSDTIQFIDESYDKDGSIVAWHWDFGDGTTSNEQNPTHSYADDGIYNVTLIVEDDDGATDVISKFVTVENVPPVANFFYTPSNPRVSDTIHFYDSSHDSDGNVISWFWRFGDGSVSYERNPSHKYDESGIYYVVLTVEDDDGAKDSVVKKITVANVPPIANFTWQPSMPTDLDEITFNASQSYDLDGYIANYTWNFGDGSVAYGMIARHSYADDGIYNVTLAVKDNDGATSVTWKLITVANVPPIANFTFTTQFLQVSFNSTSYDLDGFITNYTWDFGDGSIAYGKNVSHEYNESGEYNVTLTVKDDDGDVAMARIMLYFETSPPVTTFVASPPSPDGENGWYVSAVTINLSAEDETGVNKTFYRVDNGSWAEYNGNFILSKEGKHIIYFYSVDYLKNVEEVKNVSIWIDFSLPYANASIMPSLPNGENGWYIDDVIVKLEAFDNVSSPCCIFYRTNGGEWNEAGEEVNLIFTNEGMFHLEYYAVDFAGNIGTERNITFKIDKTPPHTIISHYISGQNLVISLQSSDNLSGVDKIKYGIDASPWMEYGNPLLLPRNENHIIYFMAIDNASNREGIKSRSFICPVSSFTISPENVNEGDVVSLTEMCYDPDGYIANYTWDFGDGNISYDKNTSHIYSKYGTYVIKLTVTDNDGMISFATREIHVNAIPEPQFTWMPPKPKTLQPIYFDASNSNDADGSIIAWKWDWDNDGIVDEVTSTPYATHSWKDNGNYTVSLTVVDDSNATASCIRTIEVENRLPHALFSFTPSNPQPEDAIYFTSECFDEDGSIVFYNWSFGDGEYSTEENPVHVYAEKGEYLVTLVVEDNDGGRNETAVLIKVNSPPIANFSWQPSMPTDIDEITFNASQSYDLDGYITNYTWDFGDGSKAYGKIARHSYADDGIYNVTLTVKDNDGATSVTWKLITVANVPPIANFTFTTQFLHVSFNSTSYDLDGFITNYTWDFGDGSIAYGKNVNHEYGGEGSYIVNLSVRDDDGSVAWISREVVVSLANHPPYATSPSPSNGSVDIAIDIQISVYVYDEDGDMLTVKFYDALNNKEIGEAGNVDSGSKATVAWNGLDFSKTYYWYVIVSDGKEETKSDIWHFSTRANSPPSKPEISGVESGYTGMTYSFSAKSNDEDGDKIRYGFDWNNDGIIDEWSDFVTSGKAAARSHSWSSEGVYYIRVIAEDEYGAKSEWSNLHQIIIMQYTPPPPNTKPFISIEEPKEGDVLSGIVEIKGIAWDEDGDEIQKVEIRIDGQGWKEVGKGANWIYTWDTTEVANGLHEIEARCYDGKDYSEVARINVTVNNFVNEPPQLKIIYPVNGSTVSGIIIIKGEAWDKNGNETLVKVEVRIDEQEWREANGTTSWSFQLDTTKFANGLHEIEVRCYDGKDYSEVARVSIEVKNEGEEGGRGIAIAAIILIAFGAIAAFLIYRRRRL